MLPTIKNECGMFLAESKGKPLLKALPKHAEGYRRVKVRKRKTKEVFEQQFNDSFYTEFSDLRNRAVFVNGGSQKVTEDTELFYIFPTDDYRFMYSPEVHESSLLYKDTFNLLIKTAGENSGMSIFKDMLQLSYQYDNLPKAIDLGCEIILYDISHYYAVRKSLVDDYSKWFYTS